MILGIEHIAVLAKDVASLKDWYLNMFEFRTVYDNGKGTYFLMAPDGSMLEIFSAEENGTTPNLKTSGIRHIAFAVDDNGFEVMVAKLKNAKVETITDVTIAPNGIKTFFFRDPEGNILHLIFRPQSLG